MKLPTLILSTLITLSTVTPAKAEASQFGDEVLGNLLHHKVDFDHSNNSPDYKNQSIARRFRGHRRRKHFGRRRHRGRHFRHRKHNVFN